MSEYEDEYTEPATRAEQACKKVWEEPFLFGEDDRHHRQRLRQLEKDVTIQFQTDLEKETFGETLKNISEEKLGKLFWLAWSHGHSSGYSEVASYYAEFSELLK